MLARFFIDRPIAAWVISIVIVLAGVAALVALPIAQYPEITPPSVQVVCNYPGASARVVVGEGMLRVRPGVTVVPTEGKMVPAPAARGG